MVWLLLRENTAGLFILEKKLCFHVTSSSFLSVIANSSGMWEKWNEIITSVPQCSRAIPGGSLTPRWGEEPPPTTVRWCSVGFPLAGASITWGFWNQRVVRTFSVMTSFLTIVKWDLCRAASKGQILNETKWVQSMWLNSSRLKVLIRLSHYAK